MSRHQLDKILFVEDDKDIQRVVHLSLERHGKFTVEIVGDSTKAMQAISAFKPDLVVLDRLMPGMDGTAVFRQMQGNPDTRDIPVVFLTAMVSGTSFAELRALGAAGVIAKPFSARMLAEQLRTIWNSLP